MDAIVNRNLEIYQNSFGGNYNLR